MPIEAESFAVYLSLIFNFYLIILAFIENLNLSVKSISFGGKLVRILQRIAAEGPIISVVYESNFKSHSVE